jgi:hypothetical protein
MPLQYGTSLDMATINENSESIYFVKPPNSQQTEQMYEAHSEPFMQVDPPNNNQDVQNAEVWDAFIGGAKDLWGDIKKVFTGDDDKPSQPQQQQSTTTSLTPDPKAEKITDTDESIKDPPKPATSATPTKPATPAPSNQNNNELNQDDDLKLLQQYLQSPDQNLQQIIGTERLTDLPNGELTPNTKKLIELLANKLSEISGSNISINHILNSSIDDIKQAIKIAAEYKLSQNNNLTASFNKNLDDKIIVIAKKMLKDLL